MARGISPVQARATANRRHPEKARDGRVLLTLMAGGIARLRRGYVRERPNEPLARFGSQLARFFAAGAVGSEMAGTRAASAM